MKTTINRRTTAFLALAAVIATPLAISQLTSPANAAQTADFGGVWQVVPKGPPGSPGGPGQRGRGQGFGPPPGGPPGFTQASADEPEGLDNGDRMVRRQMTAAGRAAFDAFDPVDHPANNCVSPGLPSIAMVPNLQVWDLEGDALTIHHEYYDTVRTVHLDGQHAAPGSHTQPGFATGQVSGDMVRIETSNLTQAIGGLARNAPGSDARSVSEVYQLSADGQTMTGWITIHDPKFLTRDINLTVTLQRAPEGTELVTFPCDIEASQRYLDGV